MIVRQDKESENPVTTWRDRLAVLMVFFCASLSLGLILSRWTSLFLAPSLLEIVRGSFIFALLMAIFRPRFFSDLRREVLSKTAKNA
jgi:hypothetical protein